MYRVYDCFAKEHDGHLVLVAVVICLLAVWTALRTAERGLAAPNRTCLWLWLAPAALVAGSGVWSTHFIAMLAYEPSLPVAYDGWRTFLSGGVAAVAAALALALLAATKARLAPPAGAVFGLGVGVMHVTGMSGIKAQAVATWDPLLAATAVGLGVVLSAAAFHLAFRVRHRYAVLFGTACLALAVCALHFVAMAAYRLEPSPFLLPVLPDLPKGWLAVEVVVTTFFILSLAIIGTIVDRHLDARAKGETERLRTLVDAAFEGLVIHDQGTILHVNESLARLVDRPREELVGLGIFDCLPGEDVDEAKARALPGGRSTYEAEIVRRDGRRVPVEILARDAVYDGRHARVVAVRDLSERRQAEARIRHLAHHDALTGLPNRALFRDRLGQAIAFAARTGGQVAVLCLDLDRFKAVNDFYGHATGDTLLRKVSAALAGTVREADTVARLGGDEFAIIQAGADQPRGSAEFAARLVERLGRSCELDGIQVDVGTSIGIALYPDDAQDPDALLGKADLALYRAKADGRGTYRFFEPVMDERLHERRCLEVELGAVIAKGGLVLHYQPQACTRTGRIIGFEALVRWPHPKRGLVPPGDFVPLAEETGLIVPLGAWVLEAACAEAAAWPHDLRVAVNLSPVQFARNDLPNLVADVLARTGLPPSRLELEITEGVLIADSERAISILSRLKELGVLIALDDFGTGYSSLNYLRRFPFDRIKIDRSFVADLGQPKAASIIKAIIDLSRSLRIEVLAEGIETPAQLQALRTACCGEIQGFLIGKPMPAACLLEFLAEMTAVVTRPG
ncbi:MAG: EAL domain-containing protein [Geminicoccaceae bacterium]|nr:EAL domain-containing protein [Geminicoccaceae bacterium]